MATFSDQAYIWALGLIVSAVGGFILFIATVYDSDRILRTRAQSSRTAALHKQAIIALIMQVTFQIAILVVVRPLGLSPGHAKLFSNECSISDGSNGRSQHDNGRYYGCTSFYQSGTNF